MAKRRQTIERAARKRKDLRKAKAAEKLEQNKTPPAPKVKRSSPAKKEPA